MRRYLAITCLAAALIGSMRTSLAQQPIDGIARHNVKVGLSSLIACTPSVGYEYRIGLRHGVAATMGLSIPSNLNRWSSANALLMQAEYRFYVIKQRRNGVMPYFATGVNYVHAWQRFDVFSGNDGWEILKEPYTLRQNRVRPSLVFGIKVNIPFGLTVESSIGVIIQRNRYPYNTLINNTNVGWLNYFTTQFATRIGWAF